MPILRIPLRGRPSFWLAKELSDSLVWESTRSSRCRETLFVFLVGIFDPVACFTLERRADALF
jgi:hypothetical protein